MQSLAIPQHPVETTEKDFDSLGLSQSILRCVRLVGFEHPTPIQAAVIPPALTGRDLIGLAETGSGKTAAFALPLAERLAHGRKACAALIVSPTREIALQTQAFLDALRRRPPAQDRLPDRRRQDGAAASHGAAPPARRHRRHPRPPARPRRAAAPRGSTDFNLLVLDEADHMLDMGFMPQVNRILAGAAARNGRR